MIDSPTLDAEELARRLRTAMDTHSPRITQVALAAKCGVTAQAVNGWRKNGRIMKRHLPTIAQMTGTPLEHFLSNKVEYSEATSARELPAAYTNGSRPLSSEASHWARQFDKLPHDIRKRWWVLALLLGDALPDKEVERFIPLPPKTGDIKQ